MKPELLNGGNLSYIGDAYYELYIRNYLLEKGITSQNKLHAQAVKYVSSQGHSKIVQKLFDKLTPFEQEIYHRGRNSKSSSNRKATLSLHNQSSGLEAVIGYLYLSNNLTRLEEIMKEAIAIIEE